MVEEDEDKSPHVDMDETDEEVQDTCLAPDDDLNSDVNDVTIKEDDCIFMMILHSVNPQHFVRASSTVSSDNLNTTQSPEYTEDKYNVKIIK
jgi:hypothetical protein